MSTHDNPSPNDDRDAAFDAALRSAHAAALEHVSPRVRAQLVQRRRAALAGQPRHASPLLRAAWPIAAAAAIGALAVGVQMRSPAPTAPTVAAAAQPADAAAPYDTLDESPDLYVWLSSDDGAALAME